MKGLKFTVFMPIHNEERYLPYSLPSVYRIEPDEVLLAFDRCTDRSIRVARSIAEKFGYLEKTLFLKFDEPSPGWNYRMAYIRWQGFRKARNDIILKTDADIILDKEIRKYLPLVGRGSIALISFGRKSYPITIQAVIARLANIISPKPGFTGIYAFSKRAWLELEEEESLRKALAEDTHLRLSLARKYKVIYVKTNTIHLREKETSLKHYMKGIEYWRLKRNPFWKAMLHSIVYLRPLLLAGYLHERLKNEKHKEMHHFCKDYVIIPPPTILPSF